MRPVVVKGLSVVLLQVCIVGSLAAKYAHDRATCPRAWVKTAYYDPDLPIRGRYASLQLEVEAPGVFTEKPLVEDRHNETPAAKAAEPCPGATAVQATTPQQKASRLLRSGTCCGPAGVAVAAESSHGVVGGGDPSEKRTTASDPARNQANRWADHAVAGELITSSLNPKAGLNRPRQTVSLACLQKWARATSSWTGRSLSRRR